MMAAGDAGNFEQSNGASPDAQPPKRRMRRLTKWLLWIGAVLVILATIAGGVAAYYLHRAEPMIREALINELQKRFHSRVELDGFRVSAVDGFWVEATGLRIWLPPKIQGEVAVATDAANGSQTLQAAQGAPWILVGKMRFHASWSVFSGKPIVISVIHVEDARVLLPPKENRPKIGGPNAGKSNQEVKQQQAAGIVEPQQTTSPKFFKLPAVIVQRVECKNAELQILRKPDPRKGPKEPLDFTFQNVVLTPDGHGGPIAFAVNMTNAKPVGLIHTTGKVGPWQDDPHTLPVEGDYYFHDADLSTIKGIAGILSSTGHYSGSLGEITVDGQTQTPDFHLERVDKGSGVPLITKFHARVDGTNGDTWLEPVDATLGRTHMIARGQIVRADTGHGHDIHLNVVMDRGRIEDVLNISANTDAPFLTGALTLNTDFHLPPGPVSVWEKLELKGKFHLSQVRFSSDNVQGKIVQLSLRGQGKPKEVKTTDPTTVMSEMEGHFTLGDGTLELPDLDYKVPGANVLVKGTYGLKSGAMNFQGNARMDATVSKMVGGWKGILLKPVDPYFKRNGAGADVPIHLEGTRKDPKFGVDFGRVGKDDTVPSKDQKD